MEKIRPENEKVQRTRKLNKFRLKQLDSAIKAIEEDIYIPNSFGNLRERLESNKFNYLKSRL